VYHRLASISTAANLHPSPREAPNQMTQSFDSIIIGTGQAGPSLASRLAKAGKIVAIAERHLLGGTCVNTGCTPTKTMVASARSAFDARRAADYGVHITGDISVSLAEVRKRADGVVGNSRDGLRKMLTTTENCTLFEGHARLLSANEVQIGDAALRADNIYLNVGARPARPKLPGIEKISYLTSSTILKLDKLPEHLIVVGGGAIGVEFAQMFRRFGSKVTLVERTPHLLQHEDEDASKCVEELFEKEGIKLRLAAECISFAPGPNDGVTVHVTCAHPEKDIHGSHVLLAMGRTPNTDDLGLEAAGVVLDKEGYITVDDTLRTNVPNIWALGDCNHRGGFTHTAYNDYEIVADNRLDNATRRVTDRIACRATYTDPPLAVIGMTEREVRDKKIDYLVATRPMTRVSRAVEKGEPFGFMKAMVDAKTKRILGAAILGVGGDEAIHCILDTMYAKASYELITHAVHIHPTVSELIPTLLESLKPAE
jgi:pyruvate/2-oxoglutarate dehydrogenase complex dihydrolipoamide dehydrogenase (E3) component